MFSYYSNAPDMWPIQFKVIKMSQRIFYAIQHTLEIYNWK